MIVLNLICVEGHHFDGWFASVDAFEQQSERDLVNCPHCNSVSIQRLPSGPRILKHVMPQDEGQKLLAETDRFVESLQQLADASEDVGEMFPEEARRIHYNETSLRKIKGRASPEDVLDLIEEGIPVLPVPDNRSRH
jgi:hypothetical protein